MLVSSSLSSVVLGLDQGIVCGARASFRAARLCKLLTIFLPTTATTCECQERNCGIDLSTRSRSRSSIDKEGCSWLRVDIHTSMEDNCSGSFNKLNGILSMIDLSIFFSQEGPRQFMKPSDPRCSCLAISPTHR